MRFSILYTMALMLAMTLGALLALRFPDPHFYVTLTMGLVLWLGVPLMLVGGWTWRRVNGQRSDWRRRISLSCFTLVSFLLIQLLFATSATRLRQIEPPTVAFQTTH